MESKSRALSGVIRSACGIKRQASSRFESASTTSTADSHCDAALAMLAGKALMTGLMALMLSAIVGLKSLASGGEKKTTYEIVSKPVYSASHSHSSEEHHGGYSGGYGRSLDLAAQSVQEALQKYGNVRDRRTARAL